MQPLQLTREADYAVLCVLEVSRNGRMSAAEVARRQNISAAFLGKIVGSLARAGILTTRRGVGGGIALARTPDALTLLEVVEAVQGPLAINQCLTHPGSCDRVSDCYVAPIWHKAQDDLRAALNVSIADVIADGDAAQGQVADAPAAEEAATP